MNYPKFMQSPIRAITDFWRILRGRTIKRIHVRTEAGTPLHPLAVVAIMRDEAPNLKEWIDFHAAQGVGRFYLFDNDSSDNTAEVLKPYVASGLVSVMPWQHRKGYHTQARAYAHALTSFGKDCQWMAFIDVDEFLYCPDGKPLPQLLAGFMRFPALIVHRHTYGTSGHLTPPAGVIGYFPMRVPPPPGAFVMKGNLAPKSVVQPARVAAVDGAHTFRLKGTASIGHDESGELLFGRQAPAFRDQAVRIDHFYTKDKGTFLKRITRGSSAPNIVYPESHWHGMLKSVEERATVHDEQILRVLPADWPGRAERDQAAAE